MWPSSVLMVSPEHFDIDYAINPHMTDASGQLHKVNKAEAMKQWLSLKTIFESLDLQVEVLDGEKDLPDMVFCANQTFPFVKDGIKSILLSHMESPKRQPEVEFFEVWARTHNWQIFQLSKGPFEGMGDAIWNYETKTVFGGYGFRTSPVVYDEIRELTGLEVVTLELTHEEYYHLDTCLSVLNQNTAVVVGEAFTDDGMNTLKNYFDKMILVPSREAKNQFAANCCCPNGKDVIIQDGTIETKQQIESFGFNVIETDTSEFIKSGGSVFCMKQMLF